MRSVSAAEPERSRPANPVVDTAPEDDPPSRFITEPRPFKKSFFAPLRPVDARTDIDGGAPQPLAVTADAAPLHNAAILPDEAILAIINAELPGASDVEREVWLEELRDVPPEAIPRILHLWKQRHAAAPILEEPICAEPPACEPHCCAEGLCDAAGSDDGTSETSLFSLDAALDRDQVAARIAPSLEAIGQARDVILNNVANAGTIGFKRSEFLFGAAGAGGEQAVRCEDGLGPCVVRLTGVGSAGAGLSGIHLDMSPGPIERTGRALDVAISGAGFLQVRAGDEVLLTRAGHLTRGAGGQIVVAAPWGPCPLEPPVVVPDEAADVKISRDGTVRVRLAGQAEPIEAGRILLARCADPTALAPRAGSLFAPTAASGPPHSGPAGSDGLGVVRQGALEQSNVDLDAEATAFRQLQVQVDALATIASGAIPFVSAKPVELVAAPPAEDAPEEAANGGPALDGDTGLINDYLRQADREDGPELR
jgi:flagellar basal-body rod protein FlgG